MKDYYYILGVKPDATATEIKAAYRKLSKKFHPDMNGGDTFFEERFKEIQEAHETLIDPSTRQRYDNSRNPNSYQKQQEPPKAEKTTLPVILGFSINKTALSSAEEFTVSWQTLSAETVTIQPFNIQVDANGNKNFRIPKLDSKLETIKIELIVQNRFGNVLRTVVLKNLEYGLLPEILSFSTNKSEYFNEENINVSWETKNAEKVTLKPFEIELSNKGLMTIPFIVKNSPKIRMVLIAENQFGKVSLVIDVKNLDFSQPEKDNDGWIILLWFFLLMVSLFGGAIIVIYLNELYFNNYFNNNVLLFFICSICLGFVILVLPILAVLRFFRIRFTFK